MKELKELIEKLETATEGNSELDGEVFEWLRNKLHFLHHGPAPKYTTSLDAKIPGENIVGMGFSSKTGKYWALHDGINKGAGTGHTEILARRIVGLRGMEK